MPAGDYVPLDGDPEAATASSSSHAANGSAAGQKGKHKKKHYEKPLNEHEAYFQDILDRSRKGKLTADQLKDKLEEKRELSYQNLPLKASLLFFAVAQERRMSTEYVKHLLDKKADANSTAVLTLAPRPDCEHRDVELPVIHVAAGLGKVGALKLLLERGAHVNAYCKMMRSNTHFYTPLHDAAWNVQKGTVDALIDAGAKVALRNMDGKTALHVLAQAGTTRTKSVKRDIEDIVQKLKTADEARLPKEADETQGHHDKLQSIFDMKTSKEQHVLPEWHRGLTAFEIAIISNQFPSELMPKLIGSQSAIDGMLSLARVSGDAIKAYGNQLGDLNTGSVISACQADDVVNKLALLIRKAPDAAVRILDLVTKEPHIVDPHRWPIPHMSLMTRIRGWCRITLRCWYHDDVKEYMSTDLKQKIGEEQSPNEEAEEHAEHHGGSAQHINAQTSESKVVFWPSWKQEGYTKDRHWHKDFVHCPEGTAHEFGLEDGIEDVQVKVVLIPNILDMDILWALAQTQQKNFYIFARLAVKGIVSCCWRNFMEPTYFLNVGCRCAEQLALVVWGLRNESPGTDNPVLPICWAILLAAVIREIFEFFFGVWRYYEKRWQYDKSTKTETEAEAMERACKAKEWHLLWRQRALLWGHAGVLCHILVTLLLLAVLVLHSGIFNAGLRYGLQDAHAARYLLSLNVCIRFFGCLYMLRVFPGIGRKITSACSSLVSLSTLEMGSLLSFIFMAIWCTYQVLDGKVPQLGISLYRFLIFGDGDGMDALGLKSMEDKESDPFHYWVMCIFSAVAGGLFTLVVLNVIVNPVYGSEFDDIQQEAALVQDRQRAGYIVMYLLEKRPPHRLYELGDWCADSCAEALGGQAGWSPRSMIIVACVMMFSGLILPISRATREVILAACFLALGQALLTAAFLHSTWIGDIAAAGGNEEDGSERSKRFLWICSRADYNEQWCIANDPIDKGELENSCGPLKQELYSMKKEMEALRKEISSLKKSHNQQQQNH